VILVVYVNTLFIHEMSIAIYSMRCKEQNDGNDHPHSSHAEGKRTVRGDHLYSSINLLSLLFIPQGLNRWKCVCCYCSHRYITYHMFGVNIGIYSLSRKNKEVAKRIRLDLKDDNNWWNFATNLFKLSAVVIAALIPYSPSTQNWLLMFASCCTMILVLQFLPHT
jgi:hypothetical protein